MGRIIVPQKRLGKIEIGQVGHLMKCVKTFKIFPDQRKLGETAITLDQLPETTRH
jgi:hypothetical protein